LGFNNGVKTTRIGTDLINLKSSNNTNNTADFVL